MEQRRRLSRWQINRQAKIKLEGAESFANCSINDINLKGAHICLGLKLPRDEFLKCCVFLAKDCIVEIEAWVVWHKTIGNSNSYGLYFTRVKDKDKEKIYRFVLKNCPHLIKTQYCQGTEEKGGKFMQPKGFEDKRIFERFCTRLSLKYLDLSSNKEGQGQTQDISAKGIGIVTNELLQPNTPLELWLEIPDQGEPFYARGEVVWSNMVSPNEYRVGVNLDKANLFGLSRVLRVVA